MPAKMFSICVDNQVTNIDAVNTTTNDKVLIYDLSGRQIKSAVGGQINIINGKNALSNEKKIYQTNQCWIAIK